MKRSEYEKIEKKANIFHGEKVEKIVLKRKRNGKKGLLSPKKILDPFYALLILLFVILIIKRNHVFFPSFLFYLQNNFFEF